MSEREAAEQAAAAWITRRDAGPWTAEDAADLEAWLAASLHHRVAYYRLHAAWKEAGRLAALLPQQRAAVLAPQRRSLVRHPVALAASVLLVFAAAFTIYRQASVPAQAYTTEVGGLQLVQLPDGSSALLNTDSALRVDMRGSERHVELQRGEAFFQVAKDASRPFIVRASAMRVVAVGTAFAVQQDGASTQVVVTEGSVKVDAGRGVEPASLVAGSLLQADASDVHMQTLSGEELEQRLSWRSGLVVFRATPLAEAVAQFNRYNKRKIVVADPSIADLGVGGVFRATDQEVFLKLLETGFPVRAELREHEVLLHPRL